MTKDGTNGAALRYRMDVQAGGDERENRVMKKLSCESLVILVEIR